jgi:hypothetical protein
MCARRGVALLIRRFVFESWRDDANIAFCRPLPLRADRRLRRARERAVA